MVRELAFCVYENTWRDKLKTSPKGLQPYVVDGNALIQFKKMTKAWLKAKVDERVSKPSWYVAGTHVTRASLASALRTAGVAALVKQGTVAVKGFEEKGEIITRDNVPRGGHTSAMNMLCVAIGENGENIQTYVSSRRACYRFYHPKGVHYFYSASDSEVLGAMSSKAVTKLICCPFNGIYSGRTSPQSEAVLISMAKRDLADGLCLQMNAHKVPPLSTCSAAQIQFFRSAGLVEGDTMPDWVPELQPVKGLTGRAKAKHIAKCVAGGGCGKGEMRKTAKAKHTKACVAGGATPKGRMDKKGANKHTKVCVAGGGTAKGRMDKKGAKKHTKVSVAGGATPKGRMDNKGAKKHLKVCFAGGGTAKGRMGKGAKKHYKACVAGGGTPKGRMDKKGAKKHRAAIVAGRRRAAQRRAAQGKKPAKKPTVAKKPAAKPAAKKPAAKKPAAKKPAAKRKVDDPDYMDETMDDMCKALQKKPRK